MIRTVALCLLPLVAVSSVSGQPASARFDSASIRPTDSAADPLKGPGEGTVSFSPGGVTLRNVTLQNVITAAFDMKDYQISGPPLLNRDRYDIIANAPGAASERQVREMLQQLLVERCNLKSHRETRELATQFLTPGKGSPKLQGSKPGGEPSVGLTAGGLSFQNYTILMLAEYLTRRAPVPVIDKTGLTGTYNFAIRLLAGEADDPIEVKRAFGQGSRDGTLPGTIAAQLGLKVEGRKAPTDFLVIDQIEKPSAN